MTSSRSTAKTERVRAAMAQIWTSHRDGVLDRVAVLEKAAALLADGSLEPEIAAEARRHAHSLAGTAGTFGFDRATELARSIERGIDSRPPGTWMVELVLELRAQLEPDVEIPNAATARATEAAQERLLLVVDPAQELRDAVAARGATRALRCIAAAHPDEVPDLLGFERPDVAVLGWDPRTRGRKTLQLMARFASLTPPVPVVVLTDDGVFADRVEVARLGGRRFLSRSVGAQRLIEEVEGLLDPLRFEGMTVLVVDDNPLVLDTVRAFLEERGVEVETLADPLSFWSVLEDTSPDLVVLDIDMPQISGVELCLVVRGDPRWVHLPILFLTAHDSPDAVEQVFAAGADDYIRKPVVGPELIARISGRLERVHLYRTMAETDPLTGLANRRRLVEAMDRLTRMADRYDKPLSVGVIDLDGFKSVNDRHGHGAGDAVLVALARLLGTAFRGEDVVARWGGEEFFVGLYDAPRDQAADRLRDLLKEFQGTEFEGAEGSSFGASFSAGVAEYPTDGGDLHTLYRAADAALYDAKAAGKRCVRVVAADPALVPDSPERGGSTPL